MAPTPLTERNRDRLLALLADDRPDSPRVSDRLRDLGSQGQISAFSAALALLAGLTEPEDEAERLFHGVERHRVEMSRALRRDPGLRVAALDYLSSVEPRLARAGIIEGSLVAEREHGACIDPLTGILDPPSFVAAVEREVRRARRHHRPCSLIVLTLARLDEVGETHGQLYADVVLERAARILCESMRESDIGGHAGRATLAIVLPATARHGAAAIGERIRARVEAELGSGSLRGHAPCVSAAIGIGCHPEDAHTSETLFARARAALAAARERGGNCIVGHHAERRAAPRRPVGFALTADVEVGSGGTTSAAVAVNLSRTGVLLALAGAFHSADPIRIRLVGGPPGEGRESVVFGRIVRIEQQRGGSAPIGIGVAFDAPLPDDLLRAAEGAH